ncbi:MAG: GIY-YIG nuclease family protein [candidate division SR1 bacterium]|nr:GIY-YIG nuclease family protein [candidate division SR1 bacterium]
MNTYYVYILTTKLNKLLYIGVTNNLSRRLYEHKNKLVDGFTKKYNINKLVYYEECSDIKDAIVREKQLKGWTRIKKNMLILENNSLIKDLSEERK